MFWVTVIHEIKLPLCREKRDVIYYRAHTDKCSAACCVSTVVQRVYLHLHLKKNDHIWPDSLPRWYGPKVFLEGMGEQVEWKHLEEIVLVFSFDSLCISFTDYLMHCVCSFYSSSIAMFLAFFFFWNNFKLLEKLQAYWRRNSNIPSPIDTPQVSPVFLVISFIAKESGWGSHPTHSWVSC